MAGDELAFRTAGELAAAIAKKEVSSRELLDLYLARADKLDESVHAVVTLDADRARKGATAADEATARGESFGPLHGLPITIKDAIETEGIRSTGGAIELTDHVPTADAPVVAQLKRSRRDRLRQDEPAAVVRRPAELQRDLRHDEQPVGRHADPAARRAVPPPRSRAGSRASRSAPTSAARSASRRTSAGRSG